MRASVVLQFYPRHKRAILGAILLILVIVAISVFTLRGKTVDVVTVSRGDLLQTVVATGRIESPARIEIASTTLGSVARVFAKEGDAVKTGQALIELDTKEIRAARAQALANLQTAQARLTHMDAVTSRVAAENLKQAAANLESARTKATQAQQLFNEGHITKAQSDDSRTALQVAQSAFDAASLVAEGQRRSGSEYKLAQSAVQEAESRLQLIDTQLANMTLRAPGASTVILRRVEKGDTAQPGKTLMILAGAGALQAVADVDEKNLYYLKIGQQAWISADAYQADRVPAAVGFIAPAVDAMRGTVEVKLDIPKSPDYLRPDMTITMEIVVRRAQNALILDAGAVRDISSAHPWVMLIEKNRTQRRNVTLGTRGEGAIEILEGLREGDLVVTSGEGKIQLDQRVRKPQSPRN